MEQLINNPILLLIVVAWSLFWKGMALWRAARNEQLYWFVAILIINSLGIVEIIYLFKFAKEKTFLEKFKEKLPWKK